MQLVSGSKGDATTNFSVTNILADQEVIRNLHEAGLPEDTVSLDNTASILYSKRWPLVVDPYGKAIFTVFVLYSLEYNPPRV